MTYVHRKNFNLKTHKTGDNLRYTLNVVSQLPVYRGFDFSTQILVVSILATLCSARVLTLLRLKKCYVC